MIEPETRIRRGMARYYLLKTPWWQTHTPMNGWGCRCYVQYLTENQAKRMLGGRDPKNETAPPIYYDSYILSKGKITRGNSKRFGKIRGQRINVPRGISPGFGHMPGASNILSPAARALEQHDNLTLIKSYPPASLPELPVLKAKAQIISERNINKEKFINVFKSIFGSGKIYKDPIDNYLKIDKSLMQHVIQNKQYNRARFLSLIPEIIEDPQEIWGEWYKDKDTGKSKKRRRHIRLIDYVDEGKQPKYFILAADSDNGYFSGVTLVPYRAKAIKRVRRGKLLYRKNK